MFSLFASESNFSTVVLPLPPCFVNGTDPPEEPLFAMLPFPSAEPRERRGWPALESAFEIEDPLRVWSGVLVEGALFSLLDLEMTVALKERLPDISFCGRYEWRRSVEDGGRVGMKLAISVASLSNSKVQAWRDGERICKTSGFKLPSYMACVASRLLQVKL